MTQSDALHALLGAARDWHAALPALSAFAPWPDDLQYRTRAAHPLPALGLVQSQPGRATPRSRAMRDALIAAAAHVEWRHTYTEAEVGRDFLNGYGWFELAGPDGHFHTTQARLTVGYWGPNLNYGWHQHEPEEMYSVVSGSAVFRLDGEADLTLSAEDTRLHGSNQPHAMDTLDQPVLTFVMWRGNGLADNPRMTT